MLSHQAPAKMFAAGLSVPSSGQEPYEAQNAPLECCLRSPHTPITEPHSCVHISEVSLKGWSHARSHCDADAHLLFPYSP